MTNKYLLLFLFSFNSYADPAGHASVKADYDLQCDYINNEKIKCGEKVFILQSAHSQVCSKDNESGTHICNNIPYTKSTNIDNSKRKSIQKVIKTIPSKNNLKNSMIKEE